MTVTLRCLLSALAAAGAITAVGCANETKNPLNDGSSPPAGTEAPAATPDATTAATTTGTNPWATATTTTPAPAVPVIDPLTQPVPTGSVANGAAIYAAKCASCHGVEARADTVLAKKYGILDFRSPNVRALTTSELTRIMKEGRGTVSEEAHPDAKLSDDDVRDMVAFIRSLS